MGFFQTAGTHDKQFDAFREGLRAAGYIEGILPVSPWRQGMGLLESGWSCSRTWWGVFSRLAVLSNPGNPPHVPYLRETERAATALGLDLRAFEVRGANDLPGAFAAMADWRADGLVTSPTAWAVAARAR